MSRENIVKENTKERKIQLKNFLEVNGLKDLEPEEAVKMAFASEYETLSPSAKRGYLNTKQFFNAYNMNILGQEEYYHLAWRSLFVPTELIYAMNLIPYTTEMVASQLAMSGAARGRIETAESSNFSSDLCSFMKAVAGGVIENIFPTPDIMLTSTHLCDPSAKYAELASHIYKRPEFILDIPYGIYDLSMNKKNQADEQRINEAIDYVTEQFHEMIDFVTEHTGLKLDEEKLKNICTWTNKARQYLDDGNDIILYERTSSKKGIKELDYAANLMQTWGTKEIVDVYKSRYEDYKKNQHENKEITVPRIAWFHLRPYFKNQLMEYVDKKIEISGSQVNFVFFDELDPKDPIRSIAKRTVMHPGFSSVMARTSIAIEKIPEDTNGIIAYYPKSCRHFHGGAIMENEMFKKAGIPILTIDGDCVDDRGDDFPIVKTRVDRFLKSISKINT
ncbi:MAG: 2-hydroxyacyl-CoA dehydratase family protein [Desulforegulaceae bacterium]|nr:2-hydroxyacyl-CoA dehydratase family protein [Desulforegulaceae bacterium]